MELSNLNREKKFMEDTLSKEEQIALQLTASLVNGKAKGVAMSGYDILIDDTFKLYDKILDRIAQRKSKLAQHN